jgi:hypothetical protein
VSWVARAFRVLVVLWTGSLWSVAIWVAPTLFYAQHDRQLAGMLAGQLFSIEAYLGVATAAVALLLPGRSKFLWGYAAAGLLAIMQWALRPVMAQAHAHGIAWGLTFGAWHGVSALLYGAACIAALLLVWNDDFR